MSSEFEIFDDKQVSVINSKSEPQVLKIGGCVLSLLSRLRELNKKHLNLWVVP